MKSIHALSVFALFMAAGGYAAEPAYPVRPVRLLVPQAAGGSNDIMARNVANHLTQSLGRQVVVDNRPGAEGIIGTEIVARAATLPDLPTIAEAGVPGYEASNWWALAVPAGTPAGIIAKLNADVATYLRSPETQKRFTNEGAEVEIRTPAEMRKMIPLDMAKWAKVAKDAGMRAE